MQFSATERLSIRVRVVLIASPPNRIFPVCFELDSEVVRLEEEVGSRRERGENKQERDSSRSQFPLMLATAVTIHKARRAL